MVKRKNEATEFCNKKPKLNEEEKKERRRAAVRKYNSSDKRKATHQKYIESSKGKEFCNRGIAKRREIANSKVLSHIEACYEQLKFPSLNVRPVSEEIKATIERRLHEELGGAGLDRCCCVVCDELVLCKESTPILWEQGNEEITKLRDAMKDCLYPPEDEADSIPKDLIQ